VLSRLVRKRLIEPRGEGASVRYLVHSPALLDVGRRLGEAGIDIDTAIALQEILQRRFARAAHELVEFAIQQVGHGFGRSPEPEDILTAIETLFRQGVGAEAVWIIFNKEIARAVREALSLDGPKVSGSRHRRR
jgi:hypothetical protein